MRKETKQCQNCTQSFVLDETEFAYYEKIGVNTPRLCPDCRSQRRCAFRNEKVFYKRPCDKCKKDVVSMYSPNKDFTVYCYNCWWSEDWDSSDYAMDYDANRSFFDQWAELYKKVPHPALVAIRAVDCQYVNFAADNKNCYMIYESSNNEDSTHCYWIQKTKNCVDVSYSHQVEYSYETDDCYNCARVLYSRSVYDCLDSVFLLDCRNCTNCIGCVNLRSKSYCILNEQYTKEEYEEKKKALRLDTHSGVESFRDKFERFAQDFPRKYAEVYNIVNSTGNYLNNVKNCQQCFHAYDAEDCRYSIHAFRGAKDCWDCNTAGRTAELLYNSLNMGIEASNVKCVFYCWSGNFIEYSFYCPSAQHCFGCVSARGKEYSILNKQYSPEEYEKLRAEIIEQLKLRGIYGEFFAPEISAFGYNESSAQDEFPLIKENALSLGFNWEGYPRGTYGKGTADWNDVPDSIRDIGGLDVVNQIFTCKKCEKNYRIIHDEYSFYKNMEIPLPRQCPECRFEQRIGGRGPNKLWKRITEDGEEVMTPFAPDRPEKIYSEKGYQDLIL